MKEDLRGDFAIRGDVAVYRTSFSRRPRAWIFSQRSEERVDLGRARATGCTLSNFRVLFPPVFPMPGELIRLVRTSVACEDTSLTDRSHARSSCYLSKVVVFRSALRDGYLMSISFIRVSFSEWKIKFRRRKLNLTN